MRPYGHIVADSEKQNSIISIIQLSRQYVPMWQAKGIFERQCGINK